MCQQFKSVFKQSIISIKNHLWNIFANIKNGQLIRHNFIYHSRKKICESFLKILWNEGFITGYKISSKNSKTLKIFLKYKKDQPIINSIKLISKPGRRIYYSVNQLWKINSNKSFIILSTNKGLKTLKNCKKHKIGGEPFIVIN